MFVLVAVLNHVLYRFFCMHRMFSLMNFQQAKLLLPPLGCPWALAFSSARQQGRSLAGWARADREAGPWRPEHAESAAVLGDAGGRGWDGHPTDQGEVATRSGRLGARGPQAEAGRGQGGARARTHHLLPSASPSTQETSICVRHLGWGGS